MGTGTADRVFDALGDPTRRALVARLSQGPMSVSDLGRPFDLTLAAVVQHLQVLERSQPVRTEKVGRVRTCWIEPAALDFRVGGFERARFRSAGGAPGRNETLFLDIVPDERIVFAYALTEGEVRTSAALTTVELTADGGGTRLLLTEQVAFLDGVDASASRRSGWGALLERLGAAIRRVD